MKTALTTGATSGIGRAIAVGLAEDGYRVIATGRRVDALASVVSEIREKGGSADFVAADLSDRASADALATKVAELAPTLNALVLNAGIGGPTPRRDPFDVAFDRMFETNLVAPMRLTRALLSRLARDGSGRVFMISSILARIGVPEYGAYCASKAGLVGFARALARDVAREKITVHAILPGWTRTAMAEASFERLGRAVGGDARAGEAAAMRDVPIGRPAEPEEIAAMVRALAGPVGAATTGQTFVVDGGAVS